MSITNLQDFKIKQMADSHDCFRIAAAALAVEDQHKEFEKQWAEGRAYLENDLREVFK